MSQETVMGDRLAGEPPYRIAGIPSGIISADDYDVTDQAFAALARYNALVEIARAAERVAMGMTPLRSLPGVEGTIGTDDLHALRAALARLGEQTEER